MALFQGLFFLVLGLGLVFVAWGSLRTGWLPFGPKGLTQPLRAQRADQPLFFWLVFAGYVLAGLWLTVFALRLLAGSADPLPLQ